MKILTQEEIEAHRYHTLSGGLQGAIAGLVVSGLIFKLGPRRYPKFNPKNMPWSMKTAIFITPPTLLMSICAEEASNNFDKRMYGGDETHSEAMEEHRRWKNLPIKDKVVEGLNNNKYKIIVGAWAGSLYASWKIIDRDTLMTKAQKAVQARMYAQAISVLLLLASVGLSVYEKKLHPDAVADARKKRWEQALARAEEEDALAQGTMNRTNEERVKSKIFRYD
ncbi:probable Respiratory supercomplex factor 2, mitochondrial [Saccharomycodes ludwigii]|uniref:Probable Respiratory supercomplex factor 2, mitochondrial n=1 Tax=Saccharomycodes ludwigii TaxID=36035 RepID=A0A376B977_9ASCO|nr:hypothetical protein SCDLUD_001213 [Saccharomycodes ludwigii]KAH3903571.1 hypothetical protein SCDLUD_001213 [Saccharomycodes ludwigii]SSD61207.1 probable Respiratory supercomplex factor 2, mitochondrial [Saccharomycodes ludwigii]